MADTTAGTSVGATPAPAAGASGNFFQGSS